MAKGTLPADVAAKYKMLPGHGAGEYHWNSDIIDLRYVDLQKADSLVARGFPYLVPKKPSKVLVLNS